MYNYALVLVAPVAGPSEAQRQPVMNKIAKGQGHNLLPTIQACFPKAQQRPSVTASTSNQCQPRGHNHVGMK